MNRDDGQYQFANILMVSGLSLMKNKLMTNTIASKRRITKPMIRESDLKYSSSRRLTQLVYSPGVYSKKI